MRCEISINIFSKDIPGMVSVWGVGQGVTKEERMMAWKIMASRQLKNLVFETFNKTRFALPLWETTEQSDFKRSVVLLFEKFNSCKVGRLVKDDGECRMESST